MLCLDFYVLDLDFFSLLWCGKCFRKPCQASIAFKKENTNEKKKKNVLAVVGVTNKIVQLCIYLYYACSKVQKCKDFHSLPVKCSHESYTNYCLPTK